MTAETVAGVFLMVAAVVIVAIDLGARVVDSFRHANRVIETAQVDDDDRVAFIAAVILAESRKLR